MQVVCSYIWLSPDCLFFCADCSIWYIRLCLTNSDSYHQPVNTKIINTPVCNVVPSFQEHTPCIYIRQHTGAATLTLVTYAERVVCIKANSDVTWHHMACTTLSDCYVHNNIPMPLVSENMYNIVIKMLMVMPQRCHCSAVTCTY